MTTETEQNEQNEQIEETEQLTPDFVWIGCRTCWWPKDPNRPVVTYQQWLNNTYRHMAYRCTVCSDHEQRLVTVFPSAWGFPMSAAFELLPGGPVPETLDTWGEAE
jgi:hypothetical protein